MPDLERFPILHVGVPAPALQLCKSHGRDAMLWTIIGILLLLWILGFSFHVAGGLIHILLVIAVVVAIFQLISGRRAV